MRKIFPVMLILLACVAMTAPASAKDFQVYGTNNGALARDECPAGSYFVGLTSNAGAWIDQVAVICAKPKPNGTFGSAKSLPSRGGSGGAFKKILCPPSYAVGSANIWRDDDYHIHGLTLFCKDVKTGHVVQIFITGTSDSRGGHTEHVCGAGEMGTGLTIRHGQYVNGLGLICGTFGGLPVQPCPNQMVWRDRFDGDTVCVKPEERFRLADGTCRSGYVWRNLEDGDTVCVTPEQYAALAPQRASRAAGKLAATCSGYAVRQYSKVEVARMLNCAFLKGSSWDKDEAGHKQTCMGYGAKAPNTIGYNERALEGEVNRCKQQNANVTPAAPAPDAPPPAQQKFVEVLKSVDLYAKPGGKAADRKKDAKGKPLSLNAGTKSVTLLETKNSWFHVKWPGQDGWVYSGADYRSLKLP